MEEQIKTQRRKLVISFSACSKKDKKDAKDRIDPTKKTSETKSNNDQVKQLSAQLSYKF